MFSRRAKVGKGRRPNARGRNGMRRFRQGRDERGKLHFRMLVQPNPVPDHCSLGCVFFLNLPPNNFARWGQSTFWTGVMLVNLELMSRTGDVGKSCQRHQGSRGQIAARPGSEDVLVGRPKVWASYQRDLRACLCVRRDLPASFSWILSTTYYRLCLRERCLVCVGCLCRHCSPVRVGLLCDLSFFNICT